VIRLHSLKPRPGSRHRVKRLGCGESSGHGKTSGKGHKGQKARSGGSIRLGFEGGQMPLIRRLPKRGFNNAAFHKTYAVVNLSDLNEFKADSVVNEQSLREAKLVRGDVAGIKILGNGELKHALKIEVDKVSAGAREKIDKAGATLELRSPKARVAGPADETAEEGEKDSKERGAEVKGKSKPKSARKSGAKAGSRARKTKSSKG
jgi:large subunit ribosomal protein L15